MFRIQQIACLLAVALCTAQAQTQIDLQRQTRNVDFSGAAATKPFKSGTALPGTCAVGELFFHKGAAAGANVYACTATNTWTVETGGSGGGSGATAASQLTDFAVTRTSATILTIGANCSVVTPCNARFGNVVYAFTSAATATISGGTGVAYVYVSSSGALTVGHNVSATCAGGCVAQSGVTGFPVDAILLATWPASNGSWSASGNVDQRAVFSLRNVVAGSGLTAVDSSGQTLVAADPGAIMLRTAVPATSSTACVAGSWATDSAFFYLCVTTNSWKRAALASW